MVEKINIELMLVRKLVEDFLKTKVVDLVELTGDASSRKYYRFEHSGKSYVSCLGAPFLNEEDSDFLKVQKLLKKNEIRVPKIYSVKPAEGFFIEEDLGDSTLVSYLGGNSEEDIVISSYEKVIDILIKLQSIDVVGTIVETRSFDFEKLSQESNLSIKYFLGSYLSGLEKDLTSKGFLSEINKLNQMLSEKSGKVFTHRDLHSRNIMVLDGSFFLIDFQDARLGLPFYDLVSLLEDCYFPLSFEIRESLVLYYWENSNISNTFTKEEFKRFYDLSAIQRLFKALGSFAFINETRNDDRYLKYVGVGVHRLLDILKQYPEFENFYKILKRSYHEN